MKVTRTCLMRRSLIMPTRKVAVRGVSEYKSRARIDFFWGMSRDVWFLNPTELQAQSDTASLPSSYSDTPEPAAREYNSSFEFRDHVQENLDNYNLMDKDTAQLQGEPQRYKLTRPTASLIRSNCVYPGVYRCGHDVATIQELAQILRAPQDWMARLNPLLTNALVLQYFQRFSELPFGTSEVFLLFQPALIFRL